MRVRKRAALSGTVIHLPRVWWWLWVEEGGGWVGGLRDAGATARTAEAQHIPLVVCPQYINRAPKIHHQRFNKLTSYILILYLCLSPLYLPCSVSFLLLSPEEKKKNGGGLFLHIGFSVQPTPPPPHTTLLGKKKIDLGVFRKAGGGG